MDPPRNATIRESRANSCLSKILRLCNLRGKCSGEYTRPTNYDLTLFRLSQYLEALTGSAERLY
jgi:hypothetical protein